MSTKALIREALRDAFIAQLAMTGLVLGIMLYRRIVHTFPYLAAYLGVQFLGLSIVTPLLFFRKELHLTVKTAYPVYFWTYWPEYALQAILLVFIIQHVFSIAMKPLEGLHELGKILFRWIVAVSVVLSVCISSSSLVSLGGHAMSEAVTMIATQVQQGICVLTLCLLLFVCFAARPLGLTPRSHIFGVSLGLGFIASSNLVMTACYSHMAAYSSLYSPVQLIYIAGSIISLGVWGTYFAMPEPERQMILLPTTSPYFMWNKVSEALGDDPGHVAIAGFRPEMLAEGEISMLTAMSIAAQEREADEMRSSPMPAELHDLQAAAR